MHPSHLVDTSAQCDLCMEVPAFTPGEHSVKKGCLCNKLSHTLIKLMLFKKCLEIGPVFKINVSQLIH